MLSKLTKSIRKLTKETISYKKRLMAENAYKRYLQSELEYIKDKPNHDRILAQELGRTYIAVSRARWWHKHRAIT